MKKLDKEKLKVLKENLLRSLKQLQSVRDKEVAKLKSIKEFIELKEGNNGS